MNDHQHGAIARKTVVAHADPCPTDALDTSMNEVQCDLAKGHEGQHWDKVAGWVWGKR